MAAELWCRTRQYCDSDSPASLIRSGGIDTRVPDSRLFGLTPDPSAHYLIETDPAFADYRAWLSSDYMLAALALDPAATQKRLGDGFYEQKLIREQVAQLTGRRFLAGYADDEAQYAALMDNGLTFAQAYGLIPGVALSAAQMAALTSDIVWLVEQEITLPDGGTARALVPQLYVRVQEGDLQSGGALIAGQNLQLDLTGDLFNGGTIAGRQLVAINAENIHNLQGRILGNEVALAARTDLDNIGGLIAADRTLIAQAGRDLTVESAVRTQENAQGSRTNLERVAGLYVTGTDGTLHASAGRDLNLVAADLQSRGDAALIAGNDLTLGSVTESQRNHIVWDAQNQRSDASSAEIGSRVQAQGDLALQAGNDLQARAASVTSGQGDLRVIAGNDINLTAGLANVQVDEAHQHTGRSSAFSSKTITTRDTLDQTTALAASLSGQTVTVQAGNNLAVTGSNVVSDTGTLLTAGRDLTLEAATETQTETHFRDEKKSGIFSSGGLGITIGTQQQSVDQQGVSQTAAASTVGSLQGDVTLLAGEHYRQTGSDVLAPQGDITIAAQKVDIVEARETADSRVEQKFKQSGLTVAITSPVVSAIQTVAQMKSAASQTNDSRMQALAVASAGLAVHQGYNAVSAGQGQTITAADGTVKDNQIITGKDANGELTSRDATAMDKVGGVNLSISLGSSKSSSTSTQTADTAAGSTVAAGRDVTIVATGAGEQSDITVQGSTVQGGRNVNLIAEDEIKLLAAANTAELHSNNQSSSGSIGVSIGTSGFAVTASASKGKAHADGQDTVWTNTKVGAGETAMLVSGGDTTLKGAVVAGNQVIADVGGDLAIESLQDTSTYDSKQSSSGFSLSIPISGAGSFGGSIGGGKSQIDSDYASVTEQSAIRAGDGGFQVDVQGDTTLTGGAITSTQQAIDDGRNRFETGGQLTLSDIENKAEYEGSGASINIGAGVSTDGKLAPQGTSAGIGKDSGSASSMTLAAISGIAGNTEARTGDAETGIQPIFDAERVQKEIDAQVQITATFGQQASKAVGDYAEQQLRQANILRAEGKEDEANAIEAQWGENGTLRLAAHTLIGSLTGGASGAAGAAVGTLTAPQVADALAQVGIDGPLATAITGLASTAAGALAGGTAGAASALNEVGNNYLYHYKGKIIAYDRKDNDKIVDLSDEDLRKLAAQDPRLLDWLIAGIGDQDRAPVFVPIEYINLISNSQIYDLNDPADWARIAKEAQMGYINLADTRTRIYVQTGMDNNPADAERSARLLGEIMRLPAGYLNNGTDGLAGDVGEYLPNSLALKDVLNEYTYRTLASQGPVLILTHSAGNEDARKALQAGALYGHQYSNLSFLSLGSPVGAQAMQSAVQQGGAQFVGQVNDWRDPVTYSKTAVGATLGSVATGAIYGAQIGGGIGSGLGPLGTFFLGTVGFFAGGTVAVAIPGAAGYFGLSNYHPFSNYIAKPQVQDLMRGWSAKNPAPIEKK